MKIVLPLIVLIVAAVIVSKWLAASRRGHIDEFIFPDGLKKKFREARPDLTVKQETMVFEAMREYFHICHLARKQFVSMPSQVVDDAWHAFILFTRSYDTFCRKAFGRFLHHTPAEAMATPLQAQDGIRRAWRIACLREKIDPRNPDRLPLLFAIDSLLGISNGFRYELNCQPGSGSYCASGIGCSSGCGGSCGSGDSGGDGGGGCGGGGD